MRRISGLKINLGNVQRPRIGSLFWWTIAIIMLGICAVLSWTLSIYIFNHPSEPIPYKILTSLKKIPPPERFKIGEPPPGKFYTPRNLLENEFAGFNNEHLEFSNKILLRDYLENFRRAENVIYLSGEFKIDYLRALNSDDLFTEGSVIRAHAEAFPNAIVELILPGSHLASAKLMTEGQSFSLTKTFFAALVNVSIQAEDFMCFTVVPIVYGVKKIPGGQITMEPPEKLNIEGKWPLTSLGDIKAGAPGSS
jgi:hypothetical protein